MEERIKKIELFIESLKNPNTFPKEIKDTLINLGFLNFERSLTYEGGAGGNTFEEIFVRYLNQRRMISVSALPFTYVVVSTSANTLSFIGTDINPLDLGTTWVILYTTDTFPGGLDLAVELLIINPTATTFQLSADGVNPIDITSLGVGTQYMSFI
jgi:hypothetical protein